MWNKNKVIQNNKTNINGWSLNTVRTEYFLGLNIFSMYNVVLYIGQDSYPVELKKTDQDPSLSLSQSESVN
jgi:hypothetical protein